MSVSYMTHPLIRHKITLLRKEDTSTNEFRKLVEEIAMLMDMRLFRILKLRTSQLKLRLRSLFSLLFQAKSLPLFRFFVQVLVW